MAQSLTNYDSVLKDFYEGVVRETLNQNVTAFRVLDESDKSWSGRRVNFPFRTARNSGVGARSEGGTLPTAGQQGYQLCQITASYQYATMKISGPVLQAGKHAFADALQSEMEGCTNDLINDLGRQAWGDATGRIAMVSHSATAAGCTAIGVKNRFDTPGHHGGRYIATSQLIDGGTTASPTADFSSATVSKVVISENASTTFDEIQASAGGLSGVSAGNFIFNRGAGSIEMMGLRGLLDNFSATNVYSSTGYAGSSVQGINRGSVSEFNSIVLGNSSVERIVTPQLLQKAFDRIATNSGLEPNLIWGHHDTVRAVLEGVTHDRRYNSPDFSVGHTALSFNGIPIERDRHAPHNELFILDRSIVKLYTLSDFAFASRDGAILSRASNEDAYLAYLRAYKQLGFDGSPRGACVIRDIKVDF